MKKKILDLNEYTWSQVLSHTHTKKKKKIMLLMVTYVVNGLNESTQSLVLLYTYNFNNSSLRKKKIM